MYVFWVHVFVLSEEAYFIQLAAPVCQVQPSFSPRMLFLLRQSFTNLLLYVDIKGPLHGGLVR